MGDIGALGNIASVGIPVVIFSVCLFGLAGGGPTPVEIGPSESAAVRSPPASSSANPSESPESPESSAEPRSTAAIAIDQLAQLADAPSGYLAGYDRDYFGHGWIDTDRNGCDTRNDILGRDLDGVAHKPGTHDCVVLSGVLQDPYTGLTISFVRGNATSTLVQIDHVVPLGYVWQVGAANWTEDQQVGFANDPRNLLAVDGEANQAKSASGPSEWLPPNQGFRCEYVERFVGILFSYQLSIEAADRDVAESVLAGCR